MLCSCVGVGADPQYVPAIVNCVNASVCVCDTQIVSRLSKNGQTNIGMDRKGRNWTAQNVHIFRIVCVLMKCFRIGKYTKANGGGGEKKETSFSPRHTIDSHLEYYLNSMTHDNEWPRGPDHIHRPISI